MPLECLPTYTFPTYQTPSPRRSAGRRIAAATLAMRTPDWSRASVRPANPGAMPRRHRLPAPVGTPDVRQRDLSTALPDDAIVAIREAIPPFIASSMGLPCATRC